MSRASIALSSRFSIPGFCELKVLKVRPWQADERPASAFEAIVHALRKGHRRRGSWTECASKTYLLSSSLSSEETLDAKSFEIADKHRLAKAGRGPIHYQGDRPHLFGFFAITAAHELHRSTNAVGDEDLSRGSPLLGK